MPLRTWWHSLWKKKWVPLKPCRKCGSTDVGMSIPLEGYIGAHAWCNGCGYDSGFFATGDHDKDFRAVAKAWNAGQEGWNARQDRAHSRQGVH